MDYNPPGFTVLHHLLELAQTHVHRVSDAIPTISSSVVPFSSRLQSFPASVFPNEPALQIKWSKYWSFSFSISPSNEYSGLISFRVDWFDLPCCPKDSQESSPTPQLKSINPLGLSLLYDKPLLHFKN